VIVLWLGRPLRSRKTWVCFPRRVITKYLKIGYSQASFLLLGVPY